MQMFASITLLMSALLLAAPATQPADSETKVVKSDAEWKKILTKDQFYILREKGTEPPYHNALFDQHEAGRYVCAACSQELFNSDAKYDSHTGWPSFFQPIAAQKVVVTKDSDGDRDEVLCARCGGHLGHVFDDGPAPTGKRFCMNSGAMKFIPSEPKK